MIKNLAIIAVVAVVLLGSVTAYAFLKPTEEASEPIEAIPIEQEAAPSDTDTSTESVAVASATSEPVAEPTTAAEDEAEPVDEEATSAEAETTEGESASSEAEVTAAEEASEPTIYEIEQSSSQARYVIDEVLRGSPVTVVGATDQVAGQIALDPTDPSSAQIGTIQINARTFATDEDNRDNAVRNRILSTDQYEYITFEPTSIVGLPESGAVGESYSFQVVGNLTIRDVTQEVTWDVTVTAVSETELQGTVSTTINRSDWNLSIPSVPFVADVSEEVGLELDFVATAQ